jgi:hypothetical protein
MTDRENQLRLDALALRYLQAVESGDFDTIDALWEQAADDSDLDAMLHDLNAEWVADQDALENDPVAAAVVDQIEKHMPSAELIRAACGPLTVAEVAEQIRRHPPAGLTMDDVKLNDVLLGVAEEVPTELGISQVINWGRRFGWAPEAYWRAFRQAALKLRMRRESEAELRMAARPSKPKPEEGKR